MKTILIASLLAASTGCAGPAGYGFGATAESYRICAQAPQTPGCENGFNSGGIDPGLATLLILQNQNRPRATFYPTRFRAPPQFNINVYDQRPLRRY